MSDEALETYRFLATNYLAPKAEELAHPPRHGCLAILIKRKISWPYGV